MQLLLCLLPNCQVQVTTHYRQVQAFDQSPKYSLQYRLLCFSASSALCLFFWIWLGKTFFFLNVHVLTTGHWPCVTDRTLTPSLPQPVTFLGWKMHRRTCKQYIFRSYSTSTFYAVWFHENSFTCPCEKAEKRLNLFSNFTLLLVLFEWHHGSDGAKIP